MNMVQDGQGSPSYDTSHDTNLDWLLALNGVPLFRGYPPHPRLVYVLPRVQKNFRKIWRRMLRVRSWTVTPQYTRQSTAKQGHEVQHRDSFEQWRNSFTVRHSRFRKDHVLQVARPAKEV